VASKFAEFIQWLNDSSIPYFIAWGYEDLPKQNSGGDVDIYVHPSYFEQVIDKLVKKNYSYIYCPANHKHAHLSCINGYSIDLFCSFCFAYKGKTTVLNIKDPELLLYGKRFVTKNKYGLDGFWVASPILEALFNALRVIGGRIDCITRVEKFFGDQMNNG